ncbi:glutathione S-transferase family protein [Limimaricola pyoseonensis]|uniref:Glutathione S-transferase n=1 Tax=Limimaricola pyoseonensis TaxID=521013 RepID=A0A1G7D3E8_9RHOB|nr:glutathione S-transferase family protein [Limimaricola pyoseonensis]SDE46122.1 glutathione S-transferase [Limimaricola pyoseonensis]
MPAPIELHYWPTPNGWKVSIALEEMGLPYEVRLVNIGAGEQKEAAFLKLSPNGRMPAIVDPEGPDGAPIAIFESGAILQYLARKTGRFCGATERARIAVDQWLMWQMGGLGPMAGQAHHFLHYAPGMEPPQDLPYAKDRYRGEVARLYGVLDRQLAENEFVAGADYTIADMATFPWARLWERQQQRIDDFPHMKRWLEALEARPAVQCGVALHLDKRQGTANADQQKHLFGSR